MKYRNRHTGLVVDFSCAVKGDMWEALETESPVNLAGKETKEEAKKPVIKKKNK